MTRAGTLQLRHHDPPHRQRPHRHRGRPRHPPRRRRAQANHHRRPRPHLLRPRRSAHPRQGCTSPTTAPRASQPGRKTETRFRIAQNPPLPSCRSDPARSRRSPAPCRSPPCPVSSVATAPSTRPFPGWAYCHSAVPPFATDHANPSPRHRVPQRRVECFHRETVGYGADGDGCRENWPDDAEAGKFSGGDGYLPLVPLPEGSKLTGSFTSGRSFSVKVRITP